MADFRDAKLWMKLAFLLTMLGFVQELFAFAIGMGAINSGSVEACLIIGFLCFLTGVILILGAMFLDEMAGNKIVQIIFIVVILIAGIITVIGIAIWGGKLDDAKQDQPTYSTMLGVCASLCAILAGIFAILDVAGVKGG